MVQKQSFYTTKERLANSLLSIIEWSYVNSNASTDEQHGAYAATRLKFKDASDLNRFRACIDLIEDTEIALRSFFSFGLGSSIGEEYIRLYGILNAVYLQAYAIIELETLLLGTDNFKRTYTILSINDLRRIAGSHTVGLKEGKTLKYFRVAANSLSRFGDHIVAYDQNNDSRDFNLKADIMHYCKVSDKVLSDMTTDFVDSLEIEYEVLEEIQDYFDFRVFREFDYSKL